QIYGSDNIAQIMQMGNQEHTFFRQQGNHNVFRLLQENGQNQVGTSAENPFIQTGNSNVFAGVFEGTDGLLLDADAYARQYNGAVLDPSSFQSGHHNDIGLYQEGESTGIIMQSGDYNTALLLQLGNGHQATITQIGNGNMARVTQQ
ncbi:MAG: hypothetical protein ACOC12_08805, partial [Bacteroidota bacterium]